MDKFAWTVCGHSFGQKSGLVTALHEEMPSVLSKSLPSAVRAHVTIQEPDQYLGASVVTNNAVRSVEAVLEIETEVESPALDDFHDYLSRTWLYFQGWRVRPTLIYDSTSPRSIGDPSRSPAQMVFIERLDGTTKAHFDRNWFVHAGHADGCEAESEASLAERKREEEQAPDHLYRQNRVVEPVTPTAWRVDGYAQLQLGFFIPEMSAEPYPRVRGEEPFDRWPPTIVQGYEYRLL